MHYRFSIMRCELAHLINSQQSIHKYSCILANGIQKETTTTTTDTIWLQRNRPCRQYILCSKLRIPSIITIRKCNIQFYFITFYYWFNFATAFAVATKLITWLFNFIYCMRLAFCTRRKKNCTETELKKAEKGEGEKKKRKNKNNIHWHYANNKSICG